MLHHPSFMVSDEAQLGDPLLVIEQATAPTMTLEQVQRVFDHHVGPLHDRLLSLEQRVDALEQQTLAAYWRRVCAWLWKLWPWP